MPIVRTFLLVLSNLRVNRIGLRTARACYQIELHQTRKIRSELTSQYCPLHYLVDKQV
ncbi:MAG: hypothetical protein QNJ41_17100 [Xenococcaceae cyanobacterium MO_188.B32]|nr:hypothetical protein [Xenococcaceae cyanobacterium MO_188.B32]